MLLEASYADADGYVEIVVGQFNAKEELVVKDTSWFHMPDDYASLVSYADTNKDQNVYFTPSTFTEKKRTPDTASTTRIAWVDADSCEAENFRVAPSFVVETSPKKYQCFWMLDDNYPTARVSELVHRMSWAHRDEGCDPSSWPENKIMRVPGSTHSKTKTKYEVKVIQETGEMFSLSELKQAYGDVELPALKKIEDVAMGKLPSASKVAAKVPDHLMDIFLYGHPDGTDRSAVRFRFEIDLFQAGFTPEEVVVAVQRAAGGNLDKFTRQNRPEQLWHEILKAQQAAEDTPVEELEPVAVLGEQRDISFLSEEEAAWVKNNPSFVDEYVEWARSLSPLSAETYQRSLAFMVLSCVYGNWGYVHPQFGKMRLNLWFIIAGDTTATRKSTARSLALRVVHAWENRSGKVVDIGSDATAEALIAKLSERDGEVSLLHRDEFQGVIKELFTKNYMSGMMERLTELYDGIVMQVLRTSKGAGNSKRSSTVFNLLMLGITEQIAGVLDTKNFASGFLPRFLWSVAEPPQWLPEHEDVGQNTEEESDVYKGQDPQVLKFTNQFELARRSWNSTAPKRILADEETWARWLQWKRESKSFIRGLPNEGIMEPARDRMSYSILKAAALMAIHGRSSTIRLEHLLPVLKQAELWFADMQTMANSIASSDFEAKVDKIEMLVSGGDGGRLERSRIYRDRNFKPMRRGEVDEFINSLIAQNRITKKPIDGKEFLLVRKES